MLACLFACLLVCFVCLLALTPPPPLSFTKKHFLFMPKKHFLTNSKNMWLETMVFFFDMDPLQTRLANVGIDGWRWRCTIRDRSFIWGRVEALSRSAQGLVTWYRTRDPGLPAVVTIIACLYLDPFLSSLELLFNVLLRKVTDTRTRSPLLGLLLNPKSGYRDLFAKSQIISLHFVEIT